MDEITVHLENQSVEVQAAAIAGLVKYYSIEGMFRAVGKLKEMMESGHEEERIAMAALFGQIRVKNFYKPLISLLQDNSPQVRIRALESAAILHVPPLLVPIIAMLKDSKTRRYAIEALAAYDEAGYAAAVSALFEAAGDWLVFTSRIRTNRNAESLRYAVRLLRGSPIRHA